MSVKIMQPDYIPKINLDEFNYELPHDKIAEYPLENRSSSKLLFADVKTKRISHHKFSELPELIPSDSLLIFNTTKVIPARIYFHKETGGLVELLLIEPVNNNPPLSPFSKGGKSIDPQIALSSKLDSCWLCIVGGKRVREGMILSVNFDNDYVLDAEILTRKQNEALVKFYWRYQNLSFSEILLKIGNVPLPPYINREVKLEDKKWYQTVYAKLDGSVAAPTAGFHFTDEVIKELKGKNILTENVVLHVGPGTFKPIDGDNIYKHEMHSERISIKLETINNILKYIKTNKNPKIIATGTTTLRTLESLYWIGCKILNEKNNSDDMFTLNQLESYELASKNILPDTIVSLETIIQYLNENNLDEITARTSLFIIPGYNFKIVNGLITNYHLPKSTLILLVAAFTGKEFWKEIYDAAFNNNYRFLSYGDSSLITNF